jgi:hypothetical protein
MRPTLSYERWLGHVVGAGEGWLMGVGSTRAPAGQGSDQDVTLAEVDAQDEIAPEDLNRMCELLARWGLRHGQAELKKAGLNPNNRVTPNGIKGYGGNDGSN